MKAAILLSEEYEETEAVTIIDLMRRGDIPADVIATEGSLETTGAHGIKITAEKRIEDVDPADYDLIITPGGTPGVRRLQKNETVINWLRDHYAAHKPIASLCASPLALATAGITKDIKGTVYPGMEDEANFKELVRGPHVVYDEEHQVLTSEGPGTAGHFAIEIIRHVKGDKVADEVASQWLLVTDGK